MGWLDAPLAGQGTQKWQNAPLLEGVPPYGKERALAFGGTRYLPPDYNSPDWVPDYSEEGVRAMRARVRDLGDIPYQDLTAEQRAEDRRLTAALRAHDIKPINLGETELSSAEPIGVPQPLLGDIGDAFQTGFHNGITWGFGDEINAGLMTPIHVAGQAADGDLIDLGKAYGEALAGTRAYMDEKTRKAPAAAFVGELIGGLVSGKTEVKGAEMVGNAGMSVLETIMRGGVEGAIQGGISAFGNSRAEDLWGRLGDAYNGAVLGAATGGAVTGGGVVVTGAGKKVPVPTIEQREAAALAEYAKASDAGVKASKSQTAGLAATIHDVAQSNGLISRKGRLDTSYRPIAEVIQSFNDLVGRKASVMQMHALRTRLTDIAKSSDPTERRIAKEMLDQLDQFTDTLAPNLKAGNALFHIAAKGGLIETAIEAAATSAKKRSGTVFDDALRAEFQALQYQIKTGELGGLTDVEIDAINKVADGTPIANVLRGIGKLTPEGVVPTVALTLLADETPLGTYGAAGAMALGAAGVGSRVGATTLTQNAAESAALIARNGGVAVPLKQLTAEELALISWLRRGASLEAGQLASEEPASSAPAP